MKFIGPLVALAAILAASAPAAAAVRVGIILEYRLPNGSAASIVMAPEEGFIRLRQCRERLTALVPGFKQRIVRDHPELAKAEFIRAVCDTFIDEPGN